MHRALLGLSLSLSFLVVGCSKSGSKNPPGLEGPGNGALSATTVSAVVQGSSVLLSWPAVVGATGYHVYRGETRLTDAPISATTFTDAAAPSGAVMQYQVTAVRDGSEGPRSAAAVAVVPAEGAPSEAPVPAATASTESISLSWNPVEGAVDYLVFRDGVQVAATTEVTYQDTGLSPSKTYSYRVAARNAQGLGSLSSEVQVATLGNSSGLPAPTNLQVAITGEGFPRLQWASEAMVSGFTFKIYRSDHPVTGFVVVGTVTVGNNWGGPFFTDTAAVPGQSYHYRVSVADAQGSESPPSIVLSLTTPARGPATPTGLMAVGSSVGGARVSLSWNPQGDASQYRIYRELSSSGRFTIIRATELAGHAWHDDLDVTAGQTYYYRISAIDSSGFESPQTQVVSAMVPGSNASPTITGLLPGTDISVRVGETVSLNLSAQDADSDGLSYQWSATPQGSGSFSSATAQDPTYTPPATPGSYQLTVLVSDGRGGTATQTINLTVHRAPVISSLLPTSPVAASPGQSVALNVTASDPDGDPLSYAWTVVSGAGTFSSASAEDPTFSSFYVGTQQITVTVSDARGATASATLDVQVSNPWTVVGSTGFTAGSTGYVWLAASAAGVPYVAYADNANAGKLSVSRFNGTAWELVGTAGISSGRVKFASILLSGETPYVAFQDQGDETPQGAVKVMTFDGSAWSLLGTQVGAAYSDWPSIALDGTTLYAAYRDSANSYSLTVKRWTGSAWTAVGSGAWTGQIYQTSIAVVGGVPYVAFGDVADDSRLVVRKYEAFTWSTVGSAGVSSSGIEYPRIAADSGGALHVAYLDDTPFKPSVKRFQNGTWSLLGTAGFSSGSAYYASLAISGTSPYVAVSDGGAGDKASVFKWSGSAWEPAGALGISSGGASFTSLTFIGGVPYVAFADATAGGKITVMKYVP